MHQELIIEGDDDEDGNPRIEKCELWWRDPLDCIAELIGNPEFEESISYVPEKVFADEKMEDRWYDEMWTGDWWWETQVSRTPLRRSIPTHLCAGKDQGRRRRLPSHYFNG